MRFSRFTKNHPPADRGPSRSITPLLISLPCLVPALYRCATEGLAQPAGLVSDVAVGLIVMMLAWRLSFWTRALLLVFTALFQVIAGELLAAVQRLPSWQDFQFLFDPTFLENSTAGFHLAAPVFAGLMLAATMAGLLAPRRRPGNLQLLGGLLIALLLLASHGTINRHFDYQAVAARYNPLHWFGHDIYAQLRQAGRPKPEASQLAKSLTSLDLDGTRLIGRGAARNVLIIALEGIPGLDLPEIRSRFKVEPPADDYQMTGLSAAVADGMLVPGLVTHSHQTIRGLYAIHCGDFSKFSYEMPKAFELQFNPERAAQCLPAELAEQGWDTHYLQGAPLQFMNKDRAMPTMGFQHVHGLEWFTERKRTDFIWGTTDDDFFNGAAEYVRRLGENNRPWLLSLLTVATHQPFSATDAEVSRYGSRKAAAVAALDQAVSRFLEGLRADGVLDDTLVIITSDESHGAVGPDWYSSWGFAAVLAPENRNLPHIKEGTYGLLDIEASVLDYLELPMPPAIIGRSLFRDYSHGRDMVSYTGGKLRWQSADGSLTECGREGGCRSSAAAGIIGPRPESFGADDNVDGGTLFGLAELLDHTLQTGDRRKVMQFASGEIRQLPETLKNEWTDNLIGAQYLDFPAGSHVYVDIRLTAETAQPSGIQMKLVLRQFEHEVGTIPYPPFPLLHRGESCTVRFDFTNRIARQSFSFHLVGEGRDSSIKLDKFEIVIEPEGVAGQKTDSAPPDRAKS